MDKLMMNKLDDMEMELDDKELDMVAGGGDGRGLGLLSPKRQKGKTYGDTLKNGFKKGVEAVENAVDGLLSKIFGPPRKR